MQKIATELRVNLVVTSVKILYKTDSNLQSCTPSNKIMQNNNNLAKHIIISLKQDNVYNKYDPYTKTTRRRPLIQSQNSHFTRSCMNVFSAQSAIQINDKGFQ